MKIIARYGVSSKYTPTNTLDSLLLAIHTNYIDGIELNLNLTKDKQIVVYQTNAIFNHPNHKIMNLTLEDLQKYNLGGKVKRHSILTLEETLKLFQTTPKLLVLNLNSHGFNNLELVENVVSLINQYPNDNIYIKSSCKEIILEMKKRINKAKIGAVIMDLDSYFWNLDLDFYSISVQKTNISECSSHIQKQLENHRFIMMGDIHDSKAYENIKNMIGHEIIDKSYIITSNVINLAQNYYQN